MMDHAVTKNVHAFHDIPLLHFKIGVWYTLNARKIIGTILFEETNSASILIPTPYRELWEEV